MPSIRFPASQAKQALKPGGVYLNVDKGPYPKTPDDLTILKEFAETGKLRAVIDRCYPLAQIVEAHRYVEQGHKKGNVVITVADATLN